MRRLARFAGGFCAAALAFALGLPLRAALGCGAGLALLSLALRKGRTAGLAVIGLGLAAGLLWSAGHWALFVRPLEAWDGAVREVWAEAAADTRASAYGTVTDVRVNLAGRECRAALYSDLTLAPGDRVRGLMRIRCDAADGVRLTLRGEAVVRPAAGWSARYVPAAASRLLRQQLRRLLPGETGGFAAALLTGDCAGLSDETQQQLRLSGTRHLTAVSGMHVGILAGALLLLLGNRRRTALLGLPAIWCFALMAGMTPSVVRAAVMQSFLLLAPLLGRENDPPTAMWTALLLILLPDPRAVLDAGLQLSFASVSGILLFSGRIYRRMQGRWLKALARRAPWAAWLARTVLGGAAAALSVIPLTLPLNLLHFGGFSLVSPLSGALLAPLLPACFGLGLLTALLGAVWTPLGVAAAWPLGWMVRACLAVIRWTASLPFAQISLRSGYFFFFLAGLYLLCAVNAAAGWRFRVWGSCAAGLFCVCWLLSMAEYGRAALSVTMLDVGEGACVYVESGGCAAIVDCGGADAPAVAAAQLLERVGRRGLDFLAVSRYDRAYAGGVAALLRAVPVDTVYLPPASDEAGVQAEILAAAAERGCRVVRLDRDVMLSFGASGVTLYAPAETELVRGGVAARWYSGDLDVLLTGGLDGPAVRQLVFSRGLSGVEVVAGGSLGAATLRLLTPEAVLLSGEAVSDGALRQLASSGAALYCTATCGEITVRR